MEELFSARVPKSSAEVRRVLIHDIKEDEGVKQQEPQNDKRDDEESNVVEVEETRTNAHYMHGCPWNEWRLKLESQCACILQG